MNRPTPDPLDHAQEPDLDVLRQSEVLDEDDLGVDPLEGGMDPPEDWAGADEYGTTATEQASDRPLTERLGEEQPDVAPEPVPERPVAATPLEELDESVDDELAGEPAPSGSGVVVGAEIDDTGESATRREGYLVTEPDQPAADEIAHPTRGES